MQGEVPPLAVFGLLQHETKLSVVNFSVKKAAALEDPLPNKTELLLVTGLRCNSTTIFSPYQYAHRLGRQVCPPFRGSEQSCHERRNCFPAGRPSIPAILLQS